ncbi:hypothetical protein C2G38_1987671 [Gigaspora rosea]|uniref:Phosphatidylglycerol/phosphatidylinositol transfer protein n=1 Tax=Gigaspora rosea TaxID=44941 RepID=A0A397U7C7_9GLOM|nr:hypothetical protein C2G38_1987671 [Gigaspora rosea]
MSNLNKYIISYIVLVLTICSVHAIPNNINKRYDSDETKCNDFCQKSKLPLANFSSEQLTGFCSSTVIGEVPSTAHLPSILITKPSYGEIIQLNKDFIFEFKYVNFEPGAVANLSTEFDRYPQSIHEEGNIIGHYHMTIQKIPSPDAVPNPTNYSFFTPINYLPNATETYQVPIPGFTEEGMYRACTYTTAKSHQCVNLPTGDRGPIDDCIRFKVEKIN